jgi:hypothetical protein
MGFSQLYRQSLIGLSDYSLVSTYAKRVQVNPDYFVTLLWRRLMVSRLLIDSTDSLDMVGRLQAHKLVQIYTGTDYRLVVCLYLDPN